MRKEDIAACVSAVYTEIESPYTAEELTGVIDLFLLKFRNYTGREHPELTSSQIRRLVPVIPYYGSTTTDKEIAAGKACEILPEQYGRIMDNYFSSRYRGTNYRIFHFMSGQIRRNAAERAGIIYPGQKPKHSRKNSNVEK